jgi:hypothetical protein
MTDLLKALGQRVRERAPAERLDELGRAPLSPAEVAALESELAEDDAAVRAACEPPSNEFKARLHEQVQRSLERERALASPPGVSPPGVSPPGVSPPAPPMKLAARPKPLPRWALWAALPAAAALALWISSAGEAEPQLLARYELEVENAVSRERAEAHEATLAAPLSLQAGASIGLVLQPEKSLRDPVAARVYLKADGALTALAASFESTAIGALRARAQLPAVLPAAGTLLVIVGDVRVIAEAERFARAESTSGPGWQRIERPFTRVQ